MGLGEMSALQAEVYEAFRSIDVPDDKALKAAVALSAAMSKGEEEVVRNLKHVEEETIRNFSKRDADIDAIRKDVSALKIDTAVLKWMGGVLLTMVTAIFFKLFIH